MASAISGLRANFSRMNASLCSSSRPYIHDSRPEGEHVLGALTVLLGRADRLDRAEGQRGHRDRLHDVVGQLVGLQRVGLVADLGEVALGELVGVGDDQSTAGQIGDVGLQRGGVHRHQDVGAVARGEDVVVGDLDLEGRDAGQGALRSADLGGVIRLRGKVVAEQGRLGGEAVTGELHAVAGVAGESDDDLLELLPGRPRAAPLAVVSHSPAFRAIRALAGSATRSCLLANTHRVAVDATRRRWTFTEFGVTASTDYGTSLRWPYTGRRG